MLFRSDSYNGTEGKLDYTAEQRIGGLPNGTYRLEIAGRASGANAFLFAVANSKQQVEIVANGDKEGSIWENAVEGSEESEVNAGQGFGWNKIILDNIVVTDHEMTIGVTTNQEVSGVAFEGKWFSADEFRLFYVSEGDNVDFDFDTKVEEGLTQAPIKVVVEGGRLVVDTTEAYDVYSSTGQQMNPNAILSSGIYIVRVGGQTVKVAVK